MASEAGDLDEAAARSARRREGVVLGVREADGSVATAGRARTGGHPDSRTIFEIGSITKSFTSLVLADGVVRGDWTLDTPVRDLLPAGIVVPSRDGVQITLQHLATHTSGLPNSPIPVVSGSLEMLRGRDPYADLTVEGLLEAFARTRLRRRPGSGRVHYSNFGAGILGVALAHARQTTYAELVGTTVCGPLGLVDTTTQDRLTAEQRTRVAHGHRGMRSKPADPWPLDGLPGAGALRSTVEDMLRYLAAQLEPDGTELGDAVRLTQRVRVEGGGAVGLGWFQFPRPEVIWWHNGGTGGFRAWAGFMPERGVAAVALSSQARTVDLLGLRQLRLAADRAG